MKVSGLNSCQASRAHTICRQCQSKKHFLSWSVKCKDGKPAGSRRMTRDHTSFPCLLSMPWALAELRTTVPKSKVLINTLTWILWVNGLQVCVKMNVAVFQAEAEISMGSSCFIKDHRRFEFPYTSAKRKWAVKANVLYEYIHESWVILVWSQLLQWSLLTIKLWT